MSMPTPTDPTGIDPQTLRDLLDRDEAVLVDVREPFEHAAERIEPSHLSPLNRFDTSDIRARCGERRVVFHCHSGVRSAQAARRFADGDEQTFHLAGGILAWKDAGLSTVRSAGAPRIEIMRQVQIVAGSLVLAGVVGGSLVTPWLYALSGFVGAGLVFAGISGWCGMAKLLARMPWNRVAQTPPANDLRNTAPISTTNGQTT